MQTVINYADTALPIQTVAVTLFNSITAFPPGGSFHLLNQQWFQYALGIASAGGTAVGTVTAQFSNAGRNTVAADWTEFYTHPTAAGTDPLIITSEDEIYVGMFKDIRVLFTVTGATQNTTIFRPNLALNDRKATSKVVAGAVLHPAT